MICSAPSPVVAFGRRRVACFRLAGGFALSGAVVVGSLVARWRGLRPSSVLLLAISIVAACIGLALVTAMLSRPRLVVFHHLLAAVAVAAALAWVLGTPVLVLEDAAVTAVAAFLAIGRLGCLAAGCCHGRPARRGFVYRPEHTRHGLAPAWVGIPLVPVPLLESAGVVGLLATALVVAARPGSPPGTPAVALMAGYATLRFGLELLRGDGDRRFFAGLSVPQWTSLVVLAVMAALQAVHHLPGVPIVGSALAATAATGVILMLRRHDPTAPGGPAGWPALEGLMTELALASERGYEDQGMVVTMVEGRDGIVLSRSRSGSTVHYAASSPASAATSVAVLRQIATARHPGAKVRLVAGTGSLRHMLVTV